MTDSVTKRATLIIATLGSFLGPFMGSSINIALPVIQKELQIDAVLLSWIPTIYLLSATIFLVPCGKLADIYGRKKIFTYGIIVYSIFSLFSATANHAVTMILYRAFQGVGGTMIFTTGVAILISVFPPGERGRVLGINVAAVYSGLSLGPVIGGFLTHYLTWRSVFLINIPFGLIIIYLIFTRLKGEWAEARGEKFDLTGSIIFGISISIFMIGMSQLPAMIGLLIMPFGILGIWMFIKWELRIDNPLVEINLFKQNRVFAFSNTAALIHYSATFALTFLLSLYLQYMKGMNPRSAGLILVFQPAMMALFSPAAGWLSDKVEARVVASSGMTITAVGLFLLIFLDKNTSFSSIIVILLLLGFGFALFSSPNANIIMGSIEPRLYGVASGMVGSMRTFGMMASMSIVNLLIAMMIGRVQITAEYFPAYLRCMRAAFIIFSCLCLIGICLSMARGRLSSEPQG